MDLVFFLYVVGMVLIIEGIPYFGFPLFMQELLKKIPEFSTSQLRLYGIILMISGLGVIVLTHILDK
ncbi:DUF2065 domain-containing protein [candidate division CSSED10-310 bacterium]|uniref:DUF2065 domain-containing protein n=1 Tax=candidate division CSSED10-310 bacterium TaxID=2855610 RepID=A0ABV6YU34_UNCC1